MLRFYQIKFSNLNKLITEDSEYKYNKNFVQYSQRLKLKFF